MLETALFALTGFFGTESPIIAAGMITAIPLHYLTTKGIELSTFLTNFVETPCITRFSRATCALL